MMILAADARDSAASLQISEGRGPPSNTMPKALSKTTRPRRSLFRPCVAKRVPRLGRWTVRLLFLLPLVVFFVVIVGTQTIVLRALLVSELESALNVEVSTSRVVMGMDGSIVMHDAKFHLRDVPGPPGEFLTIRRLRAWVDYRALMRGEPAIRRIRAVGTCVRLSQNVEDESLNVESLRLTSGRGTSHGLPRVEPLLILVDLGEHRGEAYSPLKLMKLSASVKPDAQGRGYTVALHEPADAGSMALTAHIDDQGVSASLTGIRLDAWRPHSMPAPIRPFLASLEVVGGTSEAAFAYTEEHGIEALVRVRGVSMNVPGATRHDDPGGSPLRMRSVDGDIRVRGGAITAALRGLLEDLPYEVDLQWHGLSPDSAFDIRFVTRDFQLERDPRLLPFAPALARYRFESFSRPTARVDASVTLSRPEPVDGKASPVAQGGRIWFRDCSASYVRFPYPFEGMTGEVEFDDDEVRIVRIEGRSPSGARVTARGVIGPLDDTAEAHLWIDVDGVAIDGLLREGLGPHRGDLIDELFNAAAYDEMLGAGLVLSPERAEQLRSELHAARASQNEALAARIARQLDAPIFALGGNVNIQVYLHRHRGEESIWDQDIRVSLPEVGMLAARFPYPVVGRGAVLAIGDDDAVLDGGTWTTLTGAEATIRAVANLRDAEGQPALDPRIDISVTDATVSDLLIHALPGSSREEGRPGVRDMIRAIGPSGTGSAVAQVLRREDGELGFDVRVSLRDAAVSPRLPAGGATEGTRPLVLDQIQGDLVVTEKMVALNLSARQAHAESETISGRLTADVRVDFDGSDVRYDVGVRGVGVDLAARGEDLVRAFAPDAAARIDAARRDLNPRGVIDGTLRLHDPGDDLRAVVVVERLSPVTLRAMGGDLTIQGVGGQTMLTLAPVGSLEFRHFEGEIAFDGEEAGRVTLAGLIPLSAIQEDMHDPAVGETELALKLEGGRFESNLVERIIDRKLGSDLGEWWSSAKPAGTFRHAARISSPPEGEGAMVMHTSTEPSSLAFTHGDVRITIERAIGELRTAPEGGDFDFGLLQGAEWSVRASGRWASHAEGGFSLRTRLEVDAATLDPELLAMIPEALRDVMGDLSVHVEGPLSLEAGAIAYTTFADGASSVSASGQIVFEGLSLSAGVDVEDASGRMEFSALRDLGAPAPVFDLRVRADRLVAAGLSLTDLDAHIVGPGEPGEVIVAPLSAVSHGGRISAIAHVRPGSGDHREFFAEAYLAEVAFAHALADFRSALAADQPRSDDGGAGLLSGRLSLTGIVGEPATRRGHGVAIVGGGEVVKMPLVLPLIEAANLALPFGAELDTARADFFIEGDVIAFEELSLVSPAVWIWGYGQLLWESKDLDLRFRSRGAKRWPILSDVFEGIRNQLVGIRVRGKLGQHQVSLEQLPGPMRIIDRAMGSRPSADQRRLDALESRFDWGRWGSARATRSPDTIPARKDNAEHRVDGRTTP